MSTRFHVLSSLEWLNQLCKRQNDNRKKKKMIIIMKTTSFMDYIIFTNMSNFNDVCLCIFSFDNNITIVAITLLSPFFRKRKKCNWIHNMYRAHYYIYHTFFFRHSSISFTHQTGFNGKHGRTELRPKPIYLNRNYRYISFDFYVTNKIRKMTCYTHILSLIHILISIYSITESIKIRWLFIVVIYYYYSVII